MMVNVIKINGEWLPEPDGDLEYKGTKVKTENETEAGTTMVIVTRPTKLAISGSWKLSGGWMKQFRKYRQADTVTVECFYPSSRSLSSYVCQFEITKETHVTKARDQFARVNGLYSVDVEITEL